MRTFRFRTNIKCEGCTAFITPYLNSEPGIKSWNVDLNSPQKILTVNGEKINEQIISELVELAGYEAELIY